MNEGSVIDIAVQSILLATKLAAPILGVSLAIGLFVGLIQSATQIQEQTLTFVPKLAGVALVIVITGHWMLAQIIGFTQGLFEMIPHLIARSRDAANRRDLPLRPGPAHRVRARAGARRGVAVRRRRRSTRA